jgi:hypothetical protein
MQNNLTLTMKPDWDKIEGIRQSSGEFLKSNKLANNIVEAITMVVSELVENAIKYGSYHGDETVSISLSIDKKIIIIEVTNPIDESAIPYLRHLDETIQWIRGYQDPFESYIIKLRQISSKPFNDMESGLGLVRISFEGRSILDFYVNENKMLNVSAVYNY